MDHLPSELIVGKPNAQEMRIVFKNGSTITIVGVNKNVNSLRGISCKGIVFSEFAYINPQGYKNVMPSVREAKGWVLLNSTPNGPGFYKDRWEATVNSDKWYSSLLQTYWPDKPGYTGLVPPEDFEEIMEEEGLTKEDCEREYGVSFDTGKRGAIYGDFLIRAHKTGRISDNYVYDDTLKVDTFWDIGYSDATCIWFRQRRGNKIIFIDYYESQLESTAQLVKVLEDKDYNYGTHFLPHDAKQKNRASDGKDFQSLLYDHLVESSISCDIAVNDKTSSVNNDILIVRARFSRYHWDKDKCSEGLLRLEAYHRKWDAKNNIYLKEAAHDENSHGADALRTEALSEDLREDDYYDSLGHIPEDTKDYDYWD